VSEWTDVTLGDVLTLQRGFDLPQRKRKAGPYPIVSSAGFTGLHDEFKVKPPGVVIGRYGSLGSVHWVVDPFWPLNTALWVKDFKGNDPRFISYLLKTITVDGSSASAVPGVNRNHLHGQRVRVPRVDVQQRIGALLSAFDTLIEINERRIELLEDLARSLYREWFVNFRFPGHVHEELVESEGALIPRGWSRVQLADFAEIVADGVDPSDFEVSERYVGLEHLPRRRTTLNDWGSTETVTSRKLRFVRGDTLFGKIRPNLHKVAWASFSGLASSDTVILRPYRLTGFVNALASSDRFVAESVATANGTKMPRADPRAMLAYEVAVPAKTSPLLVQFDQAVQCWLSWSAELVQVNKTLLATRDLLLPRLVTGRLDISELDLGALTAPDWE
jgi:type I restriction enzyme, S subunit